MELILAVILVFSLIGACLYLCRPPKPKSNVRSLSLGTISRQKPPVSAGPRRKMTPEQREKALNTFYTPDEVKLHTMRHDCWIIVDDKVYDVTDYIDDHPGGDAIMRNAGGDASAGFHGKQHPEGVPNILDNFLIGVLAK